MHNYAVLQTGAVIFIGWCHLQYEVMKMTITDSHSVWYACCENSSLIGRLHCLVFTTVCPYASKQGWQIFLAASGKPFFCGKKTVLAKILFASKNTFLPLKIARQDRHSSEYDSDNSGHSSDSNTDVDYWVTVWSSLQCQVPSSRVCFLAVSVAFLLRLMALYLVQLLFFCELWQLWSWTCECYNYILSNISFTVWEC